MRSVVLLLCVALLASGADAPPPSARKSDARGADGARSASRGHIPLAPGHARVTKLFRELRRQLPELDPADCVRFYQTIAPVRFEKLASLVRTDRAKARETARCLAGNFLRIQQAKEVNPAEHARLLRIEKLKDHSHVVARRISQTPPGGNAGAAEDKLAATRHRRLQLQKQLVNLLQNIFAANTQNQQVEINRLQAELDEMRRVLAKREESRELIIRGSYLELVGAPCPDECLARGRTVRAAPAGK